MKKSSCHFSQIVLFCIALSCSPRTTPSSSGSLYEEDLSLYRPEISENTEEAVEIENTDPPPVEYVEPTQHLKAEIDSVLKIKTHINAEIGYLPGFTIQIYTGRSREEANRAKLTAYEFLDGQEPRVTYDQPMFRVKVGRYYSRLEAEKSFHLLRKAFPQALVLPERIPLEE